MKKVVALVGDFYHKEELAREALLQAFGGSAAEVELHFVIDPHALMTAIADGPAAVILYAENRTDPQANPGATWMTADFSEQIVRYIEGGGGWLAWHSGLASYPADSGYVRMLRGYFLSHPEQHRPVRYSPVDDEAAGFEFLDEHYFVQCDEPNTEVFLRSFSADGQSVAGWHHSFGAGRVSCLTPAHRMEGLLDAGFSRTLLREIMWTAGLNHL